MANLIVKNLHAEIGGKPILNGVDLTVRKGETHVIMGQNGSGKSTLCHVLLSHPSCRITKGSISFGRLNLPEMKTDEIARAGILLAAQHPQAISGVSATQLLSAAARKFDWGSQEFKMARFRYDIKEMAKKLRIEPEFLARSINEGFSGGEKKKMEMLQLSVLPAKCVVIDEIDSGLDVDALKVVAKQISALRARGVSVMLITHYNRIMRWIDADKVHVMVGGKIVQSGTSALAKEVERKGYASYV